MCEEYEKDSWETSKTPIQMKYFTQNRLHGMYLHHYNGWLVEWKHMNSSWNACAPVLSSVLPNNTLDCFQKCKSRIYEQRASRNSYIIGQGRIENRYQNQNSHTSQNRCKHTFRWEIPIHEQKQNRIPLHYLYFQKLVSSWLG